MYYLILKTPGMRNTFLAKMKEAGVGAIFHYITLHSSLGGQRYTRSVGDLTNTEDLSGRLARLPLWYGMSDEDIEFVIEKVVAVIQGHH